MVFSQKAKKLYGNKIQKRGRFPGTMGSRSKRTDKKMEPTDGRGHESSGPELQDVTEFSKTEPAICDLSSIRAFEGRGTPSFPGTNTKGDPNCICRQDDNAHYYIVNIF